ncbi:MAG TPA: tetratricopeptide repeat protein [Chthonomonas sp.]|uniref:tetratricopeptide repeat protein n=1 Tax=Chthonomonas sp. TaxID=2282153 RepID=UPI002B4AEA73|nr:tetratricopeptide repeat protein [Chthonomonas sp.]HLI49071.1 tetratricopeptide repeat protein [Chthonomonas sp.]
MPTQREAGLRALKQGDFERARVLLESACWQYPEDFKAHYLLGAVYYNCRRYDQAVSALQRAVFLKPHSPQAHYNLGIALERIGKWEDAANEVRKALELDPHYEVASGTLRKWARAGKISLTPEEEAKLLAGLPRNWLTQQNADTSAASMEAPSDAVQSSPEAEPQKAAPSAQAAMLPPFVEIAPSRPESISPPLNQPITAQDTPSDLSSVNPPNLASDSATVVETTTQPGEARTQTSSDEIKEDSLQTDIPVLQPTLLTPPPIEWSQPDEVPLVPEPPDPILLQEVMESDDVATTTPPPILSEVVSPPKALQEKTADNNTEPAEPSAIAVPEEVSAPPEVTEPSDVNVLDLLAPPEVFELPTPESLPTHPVPPPVIETREEESNLVRASAPTDSALQQEDISPTTTALEPPAVALNDPTVLETETTPSSTVSPQAQPQPTFSEPSIGEPLLGHASRESVQERASAQQTAASPTHEPSQSAEAPEEAVSAEIPPHVQPKSRQTKARGSVEDDAEDYSYFVPVPCQEATEALQIAIASLILFVIGVVLGPIAIRKAIEAKRWIAASPYFTGATQANIALVLGILSTVISLLFCIHYAPSLFSTH